MAKPFRIVDPSAPQQTTSANPPSARDPMLVAPDPSPARDNLVRGFPVPRRYHSPDQRPVPVPAARVFEAEVAPQGTNGVHASQAVEVPDRPVNPRAADPLHADGQIQWPAAPWPNGDGTSRLPYKLHD